MEPSNENTGEKPPEKSVESIPEKGIGLREIEDEMKSSYLDYSMSVIVGRALPDVRDGLKPVHRRVLFAMNEMGMLSNKPFKKSARIVGEVLGKYHPHGDSAVYDTLVRMAQDFSLRYPLIDGQGNFGSIDGDRAAAMRYTEARLKKIAEQLLEDIDKETVPFGPNFDNSLEEPLVLPAKMPNLLVNGTTGIAVGMATNIPPHNLSEVCSGIIATIDNPDIELPDLMQHIKGPDFPTAGSILGIRGIQQAYATGKGKVRIKAKTHMEEKGNRQAIIVTEIPYMVNKAMLIEQMADLVRSKVLDQIHDIRDESDRDGMRIVIELKQGAASDIALNRLLKHTRMQVSFGITMLALVDNEPKVLSLKEMLNHFVEHRKQIVIKRTEFELKKAQERAHILEGLIKALNDIDKVIATIKASRDTTIAANALMENYLLSDKQAKAILEMRLSRLAALEQEKIKSEHSDLLQKIAEYKAILGSMEKVLQIIKDELEALKEQFGDTRRTELLEAEEEDIDIEDMIKPENVVVTITHKGYCKRLNTDTYRQQGRGGKGVIGTGTSDGDFVEDIFVANTHDHLLCFTNKGKVHWIKVYRIPEASRTARGSAIVNLLSLDKEETLQAVIPIKDFSQGYLMFATKKGYIKKTALQAYARPRAGGIIALTIDPDDELISVVKTDGKMDMLIATANGKAIRFAESDARPMGRSARGVTGIRLKGDDYVVGLIVALDHKCVFTITENGYGKRTPFSEYRQIHRGGSGVINIITSDRNGRVVTVKSVYDDNDLIIISNRGIVIRIANNDISKIGRNTQGVRIMRLSADDKVVSCAKIKNFQDEDPSDNESGN